MSNKSLFVFVLGAAAIQFGCGSKNFSGSGSAQASQSSVGGTSTTVPSTTSSSSSSSSASNQPLTPLSNNIPVSSLPAAPEPAPAPAPVPTPTPPAPIVTSTPPPTIQDNSVQNALGQKLSFFNRKGLNIGMALGSTDVSNIEVNLLNPHTGRSAVVNVSVDPSSGAFLAVTASTPQPYLCHDPAADPCAIYNNATTNKPELNCDSPIYFRGALHGSVGDIKESAIELCRNRVTPITPPIVIVEPPLCEIIVDSKVVSSPKQPDKVLCQILCRSYASDSTICKFRGEQVPPAF